MPGQTASPIPRRAHLTLLPARPAVTAACLTLTNLPAGVQGPWQTWPHFPKGRGHLRKLQPSGPGWDELTLRAVEGKRKRQSHFRLLPWHHGERATVKSFEEGLGGPRLYVGLLYDATKNPNALLANPLQCADHFHGDLWKSESCQWNSIRNCFCGAGIMYKA